MVPGLLVSPAIPEMNLPQGWSEEMIREPSMSDLPKIQSRNVGSICDSRCPQMFDQARRCLFSFAHSAKFMVGGSSGASRRSRVS